MCCVLCVVVLLCVSRACVCVCVRVCPPEKRRLGEGERPLWERMMQGPSDDIMRMFLMDRDEEEVSNDVRLRPRPPVL